MQTRPINPGYALIYLDRTQDDRTGWSGLLRVHGEERPDDEWVVLSDYYPIGSDKAKELETWTDEQLTERIELLRFWTGQIVIERE